MYITCIKTRETRSKSDKIRERSRFDVLEQRGAVQLLDVAELVGGVAARRVARGRRRGVDVVGERGPTHLHARHLVHLILAVAEYLLARYAYDVAHELTHVGVYLRGQLVVEESGEARYETYALEPHNAAQALLVRVDGGEQAQDDVEYGRRVHVAQEKLDEILLGLHILEKVLGFARDQAADDFGKVAGHERIELGVGLHERVQLVHDVRVRDERVVDGRHVAGEQLAGDRGALEALPFVEIVGGQLDDARHQLVEIFRSRQPFVFFLHTKRVNKVLIRYYYTRYRCMYLYMSTSFSLLDLHSCSTSSSSRISCSVTSFCCCCCCLK